MPVRRLHEGRAPRHPRRPRPLSVLALCLGLAAAGPSSAVRTPVAQPAQAADPAAAIGAAIASRDRERLGRAARWFRPWRARPRSPRLAVGAIRLARACRERAACDGYYPLRYAHAAADPATPGLRIALANEFLGIDLPWLAIAILDDRQAGPPSAAETALRRRAEAAARITVEDAAAVMPPPEADGAAGSIAGRLWSLFGVPALALTGRYLDPDFRYAPRRLMESDPDFLVYHGLSRRDWRRLHSTGPILPALFAREYRPALERLYRLEPPAAASSRPLALSPAALARLVATAERGSGEAARVARAGLYAHLIAPWPWIGGTESGALGPVPPPAAEFAGAAERDGVWLVWFREDPMLADQYVAVVPRAGRTVAYLVGEARTAWFEEVDGLPGAEIVLSADEGSARYLYAQLFSPASGAVSSLAYELYHGQLALVDLDGDPAKEIVVSRALSLDARYEDCNQCPKRRAAYILDFDERGRRFRAVSAVATGAEDESNASGNLAGVSPTMLAGVSAEDVEPTLRRLAGAGSRPAAADVDLALAHALSLADAEQYSAALRLAASVARRLEPPIRPGFGERYLRAEVLAGQAEVETGDPRAALARLRRIPSAVVDQGGEAARSYWSLVAVAAMTLGDSATAYEAMQRERALARAGDRSPGEGNLAMLFSHFGAWRAARDQTLLAVDLSLREDNPGGLALMMINAAEAERRAGDLDAALDWLERALRWTRSFADSGHSVYAIQVAAAVALDAGLPDLAIALLDVGLMSHTTGLWRVRGPDHLLLYGRALERKGRLDQASWAFIAAARLAGQRAGLRSVEAWAEVGRLALRRSDPAGAREAYRRAFVRIAEGRRSTPTDAYKIGYLQNVDAIAERHFALSPRGSEEQTRQLASDLEAWKFQVFSDRYAAASGVEPDIVRALQRRLRPNEAYVSYFISPSVSFAIVVTRDAVRRRDLALAAEPARRLRAAILGFMDLGDPAAAAYIRQRRMPRRLHRLLLQVRGELVAPLALDGGIDTLLINEDEDLAGIPWAAVPPAGDSWVDTLRWWLGFPRVRSLLERYRIAMVPSARLALREAAPRAEPRRVVIAAALGTVPAATVSRALGVASREDRYASLPPLRQGVAEVEAVRSAFAGSPALLLDRFAASRMNRGGGRLARDSLRAALAGATIWHFVGHGVFNRVDPMASALFLGDGGEPQWVNATDLAGWDLGRVRFVALSACETGTARPEVGAETFGLLRGLLGGGVGAAMVMAWPVDDAATSHLYRSFYRRFGAASLADAHRSALLEAKAVFRHPFYWSAATLYGDWR